VALAALTQCGRALEFAAAELKSDRAFMLAAVQRNGRALKHAGREFRADREVALVAVQQSGSALAGVAASLRADPELVAQAVARDGRALAFAAAPLRKDPELGALAGAARPRGTQLERSGSFSSQADAGEEAEEARAGTKGSAHTCFFGEGRSDGHLGLKRMLGARGAHLCEMAKLGLPVPPGFCITVDDDRTKSDSGAPCSTELWGMVKERLVQVEQATGLRFGDPNRPLLLSVRGDSVDKATGLELQQQLQQQHPGSCGLANVGLNDAIVEAWASRDFQSPRVVWDSYRRLIVAYAREVKRLDAGPFERELEDTIARLDAKCQLGRHHHDSEIPTHELQDLVASYKLLYRQQAGEAFPQNPEAQLREAIDTVLRSEAPAWLACQELHGNEPRHAATASVQAAVLGNCDGKSGVGMVSLMDDGSTIDLVGQWLANAQAGDLAGGLRMPQQLTMSASREWAAQQGIPEQERAASFPSLEEEMPAVYANLMHYQDVLSCHLEGPFAVEFAVQQGTLWLLQSTPVKQAWLPCESHLCSSSECGRSTTSTNLPESVASTEGVLSAFGSITQHDWQACKACAPERFADQGCVCGAGLQPLEGQANHLQQGADPAVSIMNGGTEGQTMASGGDIWCGNVPSPPCFEAGGTMFLESAMPVKAQRPLHQSTGNDARSSVRRVSGLAQPPSSDTLSEVDLTELSAAERSSASVARMSFAMLKLPLWQTILAGGLAGFASRWAAHSAEGLLGAVWGGGGGPVVSCKAAWHAITSGLSAGALKGCARAIPTGAVCCSCYVNLLSYASADGNPDSVAPLMRLGCAATAATAAGALTHPIDVVRSRLADARGCTHGCQSCSSVLSAFALSGGRGLFRGALPAMTASVPVVAVELCTIDLVKGAGTDAGWTVTPGLLMGAGGVAGALSQTFMYPLSVARGLAGNGPPRSSSGRPAWKALHATILAQGPGAIFKGIGAAYTRSVPAVGVNSLVRVGMLTHFLKGPEHTS